MSLEDFAVFKANWNNKAENIEEIIDFLNIGKNSVMFIDDNPTERQIVKDNVMGIKVLDFESVTDLIFKLKSNYFFQTRVSW